MRENLLLMFIKYPAPGHVKTRLAASLGDRKAAQVYKALTEYLIFKVVPSSKCACYDMILAYAPADAEVDMQEWLGKDMQLLPQTGANLGERMQNSFAEGFALGYKSIVIIGSDCPAVSQGLIIEALHKLEHHDVVIGPATDGGYYLIGLRQAVPELFYGIEWSTDKVLSQTLKLCDTLRISAALLTELRDIDHPEDLTYYRKQGLRI